MKRTKEGQAMLREVMRDTSDHLDKLAYDISVKPDRWGLDQEVSVNVFITEDGLDASAPVCSFTWDTPNNSTGEYNKFYDWRVSTAAMHSWLDWTTIRVHIASMLLAELASIDSPSQVVNHPADLTKALESLGIPRMVHDTRIDGHALVSPSELEDGLTPFQAFIYDSNGMRVHLLSYRTVYAENRPAARAEFVRRMLGSADLDKWITQGAPMEEVNKPLTWYAINGECIETRIIDETVNYEYTRG